MSEVDPSRLGSWGVAPPDDVQALEQRAKAIDFDMNSGVGTGWLLRSLVASKPGGRFLELGTGIGVGACWLLGGMDKDSTLVTVDVELSQIEIARAATKDDPRIKFVHEDGAEFLERQDPQSYDLIFADALPGKFTHLDVALSLLKPGGFWVGDDLLPQPNWPEGHAPRAVALRQELRSKVGFVHVEMAWDTGLVLLVRA